MLMVLDGPTEIAITFMKLNFQKLSNNWDKFVVVESDGRTMTETFAILLKFNNLLAAEMTMSLFGCWWDVKSRTAKSLEFIWNFNGSPLPPPTLSTSSSSSLFRWKIGISFSEEIDEIASKMNDDDDNAAADGGDIVKIELKSLVPTISWKIV